MSTLNNQFLRKRQQHSRARRGGRGGEPQQLKRRKVGAGAEAGGATGGVALSLLPLLRSGRQAEDGEKRAKEQQSAGPGGQKELPVNEDIDEVIKKQEKTLAGLYKKNKVLFDKISSKEYQVQDVNEMCKEMRVGNHSKQSRGQGSYRSLFAQNDPLWTEATSKLSQMEPEWFRGKRVLDIGSHEGAFDLALAARFGPKLLIGVDIDHKMTSKAMKNMHECINNSETMTLVHTELKKNNQDQDMNSAEEAKEEAADPIQDKINDLMKRIKDLPKSMQLSFQGQINQKAEEAKLTSKLTSDRDTLPSPKDMKSYLYGKVSFRTENYIASIQPSQDILLKNEKFDTIMCLSTSKYIHLNFGDQGMNALFLKVYHQLESGGHFILEPQQWKSYKKEKSRCPQFKAMCESVIQLKPGLFLRYLKDIGFHHVKTIQYTCQSHKEKIVYVLKKA